MEEQILAEPAVSLWEIFILSGPIGITLFIVSISVLLCGLIVFLTSKTRRPLGIWLISFAAKFGAISSILYFFDGCVRIRMITLVPFAAVPFNLLMSNLFEACIGPMFLALSSWLAVVVGFLIQVKEKFSNQPSDPT